MMGRYRAARGNDGIGTALDASAEHDFANVGPTSQKQGVVVGSPIAPGINAMETIQVELALKGCQLGLFKVAVFWESEHEGSNREN